MFQGVCVDNEQETVTPGVGPPMEDDLIERRHYPLSVITIVIISPLALMALVLVIKVLIGV